MVRLAILLSFIAPLYAAAFEMRASDQVSLLASETIVDDLYAAGGAVSQLGTVRGDFFATGGQVLSQGLVTGDMFIAAGGVTTVGTTTDDVRIVGGNVTIHGAVGGDLLVFGGHVLVSGPVAGDVVAYGGTVRIDTPIRGDVYAGGGTVELNSSVGGDARIDAEKLILSDSASLAGALRYSAISAMQKAAGATIAGEVTFTPRPNVREAAAQGFIAFLSVWFVLKFLMLLVGSLVISYFFNSYAVDLIGRAKARPVQEFALGLATMIVLPVISIILIVSIIGLPLGLLGILGFLGLGVFAHLIGPILFGSFLYSWISGNAPKVTWKTTTLGATIFYLIWFVPIVGWLARAFFIFLALGVAISFKWDIARKWH